MGHCTEVTDSKAAAFGGTVTLLPPGRPQPVTASLPGTRGFEKAAENLSWRGTENFHDHVYSFSILLRRCSLHHLCEPGDSTILLGFLNQLLKYLHKKVKLLPTANVINVDGDKV